MCRVLDVSISGYYAWRKRQPSQRAQANVVLVAQIRQVHQASKQRYGSPRVQRALRALGYRCTQKRVARLMQVHGIRGKCKQRRQVRTTDSQHRLPVAPNRLAQHFTATAPNQKWLADLTYIPTAEGWLYLAAVMDLFSRKIVGWAMDERMTTDLVTRALLMACRRRQPAPGLLHHSDRGSQYASHEYQRVLAAYGMVGSMSRRGNCYDNAPIESFWGTLKTEAPDTDQRWATRQQAKTALFTYLEGFYNHRRLHSTLGYQSPDQFERLLALGA
jgi:transposase InsO family protein